MRLAIVVVILAALLALASAQTVQNVLDQRKCSTAAVAGLARQLVEQTNCISRGLFAGVSGLNCITLSSAAAAVPFLQTPAQGALECACRAQRSNITVNSALRTLPQQLLLYKWYTLGACNIAAAAQPGRSNHEAGLAVDVNNADAVRTAMEGCGWKKLGSWDPPHYDYVAGGRDIRQLSILAFQKLWNLNNPAETLPEDGLYGPKTESALLRSPSSGFSRVSC